MSYPANFSKSTSHVDQISADDTSVMMKVFFLGDEGDYDDAQIVNGASTLVAYKHYAATQVVDDTFATAGTLTFATGAANITYGQVAALFNASPNWKAVLVAARPEDLFYTHSGTVKHSVAFAADSATAIACNTEVGSKFLSDSTDPLLCAVCIGLESTDATFGLGPTRVSESHLLGSELDVTERAADGKATQASRNLCCVIDKIYSKATVTGADTINVYASTQLASRLLWSVAGGGTGTAATQTFTDGLFANPGERLIVQYSAASAMSSPILQVYGGWGTLVPA